MGNKCVGHSSSTDEEVRKYMENDFVKTHKDREVSHTRSSRFAHVRDEPTEQRMYRNAAAPSTGGHGQEWYSTFNGVPKVPLEILIEHYQPYEFPICPVINSHTQTLVKTSWAKIIATEYDCEDTASGKISGASYFYNHFFNQLFKRLADFSRIFPDIKTRADIFSKVMSFCISIRVEEVALVKVKLHGLGLMHKQIIHHPYLFGIYASNMHSTIRHCLGEDATYDVMSAWLHLLSFIMRGMLPSYFEGLPFGGHFSGAVNAASVVTEKATEEVKNADEMRILKKKLKSMNGAGVNPRGSGDRTSSEETNDAATGGSSRSTRLGASSPLLGERERLVSYTGATTIPGEANVTTSPTPPIGSPLITVMEKRKIRQPMTVNLPEPEEMA